MADEHAPEPPRAASQGHAPEPPRAQPPPERNQNIPLPDWLERVSQANPDERVFMVGQDGSRIAITAKEIGRYGRMGFRLESPDETKQSALAETYNTTGNQFLAAAEGAASSLTLGGSDIALSFLDPEGAQQRANQFGFERGVGAVAGGLLSLKAPFLPGGLAIRAGENVGGHLAATGVVRGLTGAGGVRGVVGRALPAIGRESVEGMFFGAGEGAGQTFLSDRPINAEALLGNIGTGALWGGGIGGAFGLGGSLVGDSIDLSRKYFQKGANHVIDKYAPGPPSADLVRAGQAPPRLSPGVRARAGADLKAARGEQATLLGAGREAQAAAQAEGRSAAEALQWFRGDYDTLDQFSGSVLRRIEKAGDAATPEMKFAHDALTEARANTRQWLEQNGVFKRSTAITDDLNLAPEKRVKRINDWGDDEALANALGNPDFPNVLAAQEEALARAKEIMDGPPSTLPGPGAFEEGATYQVPVKELEARGLFELPGAGVDANRMARAKSLIGKPEEHGQPITLAVGDDGKMFISDGRHRLRAALESGENPMVEVRLEKAAKGVLDNTVPLGRPSTGKPWAPFKVQRDVFSKVSNYDDVMLRATGGVEDPALAAVKTRIDQLEELLATGKPDSKATIAFAKEGIAAAERAGIDVSWPTIMKAAEESGIDVASLAALSPEAKTLFAAQYTREAASRALQARAGKVPLSFAQKAGRSVLASAAGWAVGGHVGAALAGAVGGGLLGRMLRGTSVGMARKMAYGITDISKRMAKGVDVFLGGIAKGARSPKLATSAIQILKGTAFADPGQGESKKLQGSQLQQEYQRRANELNRTAAAPMDAKRKINDSLMGVRITDPGMADQLGELIMRRLEYIHDVMPKAPYPQNPFTKTGWIPSDAEISKWSRCIEVAENPEAVFRHMEDGTLTVEHTEALKAVYPLFYNEIQMDIISQAAQLKAELPWAKRVTLSTLFEAPTDDILRPENVFLLQESYSEPSSEQPGLPPPRPPSTSTHSPTKAQQLSG